MTLTRRQGQFTLRGFNGFKNNLALNFLSYVFSTCITLTPIKEWVHSFRMQMFNDLLVHYCINNCISIIPLLSPLDQPLSIKVRLHNLYIPNSICKSWLGTKPNQTPYHLLGTESLVGYERERLNLNSTLLYVQHPKLSPTTVSAIHCPQGSWSQQVLLFRMHLCDWKGGRPEFRSRLQLEPVEPLILVKFPRFVYGIVPVLLGLELGSPQVHKLQRHYVDQ